MHIAHVTDLHFGAADAGVVQALQQDLLTQAPDVVVVTGDLTQHGSRREFAEAAAFLQGLPGEVVVIPGNHDTPSRSLLTRALRPWSRFRRHIHPDLEPRLLHGEVAFAGINSARRARPHWNWSLGRVSSRQVAEARTFFETTPATARVLAVHHPLVAVGGGQSARPASGAGRLLEMLMAAGVDLVLCGHSHRRLVMQLGGEGDAPAVAAADGAEPKRQAGSAPLLVVQSTTATSHRQRGEQNGYTRIEIDHNSILIEPRAMGSSAFHGVWRRRYPRQRPVGHTAVRR